MAIAKKISAEDKAYLLSLKPDDIDYKLGMDLFADKVTKDSNGNIKIKESRFEPTDEFDLKAGEYINRTDVNTTVGLFIFNKFIVEPVFSKFIDYVNFTIDDKGLGKFEGMLSQLLLTDEITTADFADYLNRIQWLGMQFHEPLAASFTMRGMKPVDKVIKARDKMIKDNKEALDKGDILVMSSIEKTLVKMAEEEIGDDPSMDLYYSGARGSISNNYKQLSIVKGPIMNKTTGKYEFVKNCFYEGIKKEDIAATATNVTNGAYPKACGTAISGYKGKQISAAMQSVVLRDDIKDCNSKGYVDIVLVPEIAGKVEYREIIENGKLVTLTKENIPKYIGKRIKLRSIMYCGADYGVCLTCAGTAYQKLGIKTIGLTARTFTGALLNMKMKSFHDTSVKVTEIDLNDLTF